MNVRYYNWARDHRNSLFADNAIFLLSNLNSSIPNMMRLIENFREFSGYKINNSKSVLLFLNKEERRKPIINTHS